MISPVIFGTDVSIKIAKIHLFGLLNHVLGPKNLSHANHISLTFVLNVIVDES